MSRLRAKTFELEYFDAILNALSTPDKKGVYDPTPAAQKDYEGVFFTRR